MLFRIHSVILFSVIVSLIQSVFEKVNPTITINLENAGKTVEVANSKMKHSPYKAITEEELYTQKK